MAFATIVKEFTFDAAHRLEGHHGHCGNIHGHTYKLQVGVCGTILERPGASDDGMVLDFGELKQVVKTEIINRLDHQFLNEVLPFRTTAENISVWAVSVLRRAGLPVKFIRLYETPTSYVEIDERDVPVD
ncbi:queuosine biosynthesis protein QueD [Acididesulfobacillus acetoxydans]|uniref:6-carboxy-5,6,7,8-tetrahydropterin synthase n=1 Tax=Acididesulfobacillus acetoxydans TaxID=1561005 RepID=A0A8S0XC47_9FIRM|nr:6-carboxytetrahydropterin synthase QueD [Acididesulfobacillus acetoxydans]CAA7602006.1 queuosine biosynthesis protein QueD [Acididesulfobacillus acetoxydans]CEJ08151.1 6-carboxy-5,6,7,8-tetrahydropterin synthase [Acididesulfobacillus acetoxydans]